MTTAVTRKPWTEKQTEYLMRHAGKKTYREIAEKLGRSESSVGTKAFALGVRGLNRNWTQEEDDAVLSAVGDSSIEVIAKRLHRSPEALISRMEKLGVYDLGTESGAYRTYEFADILGVDPSTVLNWVKTKGLPARQLYKQRNDAGKSRYHYLFAEDFWKWAKKHPDRVHFAKIQRGVLLPEPDWLEETIASEAKAVRHQAEWTTGEDRRLREYIAQGKTQREAGELLSRTASSVQHRIKNLKTLGKWEQAL